MWQAVRIGLVGLVVAVGLPFLARASSTPFAFVMLAGAMPLLLPLAVGQSIRSVVKWAAIGLAAGIALFLLVAGARFAYLIWTDPQFVQKVTPEVSDDAEIRAHMTTPPSVVRVHAASFEAHANVFGTVGVDGRMTGIRVFIGYGDLPFTQVLEIKRKVAGEARTWRFKPFEKNGRPTPTTVGVYVPILPLERLPTRHVAFPTGDAATASIMLERTACYGTCPVYEVTIDGAGAVRYEGVGWVAVRGVQTGKVDPARVAALVERFRGADFFSLGDRYYFPVTDNPTQCLTITIGGRSKTVTDYVGQAVGMPQAVDDLEAAVDELANTRQWVGDLREKRPQGDVTSFWPRKGKTCGLAPSGYDNGSGAN